MQAVSIGSFAIFPCFTPGNTGEDKHNGGRAGRQRQFKISAPALFRHMPGWIVVVQAIWPPVEIPCHEMELRWVQISR